MQGVGRPPPGYKMKAAALVVLYIRLKGLSKAMRVLSGVEEGWNQ